MGTHGGMEKEDKKNDSYFFIQKRSIRNTKEPRSYQDEWINTLAFLISKLESEERVTLATNLKKTTNLN